MQKLLGKKRFYIGIALLLLIPAFWLLWQATHQNNTELITATVARGDVVELVSVSGFVEAQNAAELAFPVTGIVENVLVSEGDTVTEGDTLITLARGSLLAERQDAVANLLSAQADRDELISGPRSEARSITSTEIAIAEESLLKTRREELEKVNNTRRALLSSSITALSTDGNENAVSPTISGSYICEEEGSYVFDVFRSGAESGYSFRLSGLETGTYTVFTDQPGAFGNCGLYIVFANSGGYSNSSWVVSIPNKNSASYVTNLNSYELALEQAENNIRAAEQALELANKRATLDNAAPREEAIQRANAKVTSAQARLAAVDAQIKDRIITTPFDGTITALDVLPGETVGASPIVTVLANDTFDMTARIPEIDITKLEVGQNAVITFDASTGDNIPSTVHFISPIAVEIDGVAYFEATMVFEEAPSWLRSGLNADVDIIVDSITDTLRVPKRFIITDENDESYVLIPGERNQAPIKKAVDVLFSGNDGYVALDGIAEGTTVIAP